MKYILVDNGSIRAESVLNLRRIAKLLSNRDQIDIVPASLLHSSKVPGEKLDGEPAVNFEPRLKQYLQSGERDFTVLPFFFGPTQAILDYMPGRIASLKAEFGDFNIRRTPFLFDDECKTSNAILISILADNVRSTMRENGILNPMVVLVDHGSPVKPVTEVRNRIADLLREELSGEVVAVEPASMERRPGDQYAFNEPLLEQILTREKWRQSNVVVALLFLSPGRHAGPSGDIDQICSGARSDFPGLSTYMTGLVGTHPLVVDLLSERIKDRRLPLI